MIESSLVDSICGGYLWMVESTAIDMWLIQAAFFQSMEKKK
jgi:hypothetical protein